MLMVDRTDALERILNRIDSTATLGPDAGFPHYGDPATGDWTRSPTGDWTGGFWIGMLWLAATLTGEEQYQTLGRTWALALRPRVHSDTIFRGFLFWYGAAHGARLHDDEIAKSVAIEGAVAFSKAFNSAARLIPLGFEAEESSDVGRGEANIDGVPGGTPLLVWASDQIGDPSLRSRGLDHAESHIDLCVRDDDSVVQSGSFDVTTGRVRRRYTHKGWSNDSTWTRAQARAMLGFAQSAAIDAERFSPVLRRVCDWWVEHVPAGAVAFWDFDAGTPPLDTSGTAIAAASLLKAAVLIPDRAEAYRASAEQSVDALVLGHLTSSGILTDGCYNQRIGLATSNELIWGDYFLFEALCVLDGSASATVL
jgi:unsaturated chondroitin disaccharide hydrolase